MGYISENAKLVMLDTGLQAGTLHWWVMLPMTTSSIPSEPLKHTVSAYSTLAEFDGAGYVRKQITSSVAVTAIGNGLVKVTATSPVWVALPAGTHGVAGALVYLDPDGTNTDTGNIPIVFDNVNFPRTPDGSDFPWLISANGFLQL